MPASCSSLQLMAEPMWLFIAIGSSIIGRGRQKRKSATGQRDRLLLDTRNKWRPYSHTAPLVQPNPRLCSDQTTTRALTGLALVGEGHLMLVALSSRHAPGAASHPSYSHTRSLFLLSLGRAAGLSFDILFWFPASRPYIKAF